MTVATIYPNILIRVSLLTFPPKTPTPDRLYGNDSALPLHTMPRVMGRLLAAGVHSSNFDCPTAVQTQLEEAVWRAAQFKFTSMRDLPFDQG